MRASSVCVVLGVWGVFCIMPATRAAVVPTLPGDLNYDWSVDAADFALLLGCLVGPKADSDPVCTACDLNGDHIVDTLDVALFQDCGTGTQYVCYEVPTNRDDGTEVNNTTWRPDGPEYANVNWIGRTGADVYHTALRFVVPELVQGDSFVLARLLLPASDDGQLDSTATLRIVGIDQDTVAPFDEVLPSQTPKTTAVAYWNVDEPWPDTAGEAACLAFWRPTPNLAPLVNQILDRSDWGSDVQSKTLGFVIEDAGSSPTNYVCIEDHHTLDESCAWETMQPRLELYRTLRSTFVGKELLGCVTDHSVRVNACSLVETETYVEYGTQSGDYEYATAVQTTPAGEAMEVVLEPLLANTRYYYRLRFRQPGDTDFATGPERTFHTQRPSGEAFIFTVQADSHMTPSMFSPAGENGQALYRRALRNAAMDQPDFHIDLGDTFFCGSKSGRDVLDLQEAIQRHAAQRTFFDMVCHSAPFFMALGNHESEKGWYLDGTENNVAVWATKARKLLYPLPQPNDFYTGNLDVLPFVGAREDYYAWEWGDALFIVIDPFWYTTTQPHSDEYDERNPGSGDRWDWTLAHRQYAWLAETLANSTATYRFVFAHHVTGGTSTYGRGGIEAASHEMGGCGSYEWGGENYDGDYVFDVLRPGWGDPIHKLMSDYNVTIFFHGHDHVFVKQALDGVVYQECPQPSDVTYDQGYYVAAGYMYGDKVNNSGHLRITVAPSEVTVDYIRSWLPGDGSNGELAYTYTIPADPPKGWADPYYEPDMIDRNNR